MTTPPRPEAPSRTASDTTAAADALSCLAHACESLAVQDAALPRPLIRSLVDVASALRAEAARRRPR